MDSLVENLLRLLVVLAFALLVVGWVKPGWLRFRGKEPNRMLITVVAVILFMGAFTGLGEVAQRAVGVSELEQQLGAEVMSKATYRTDAAAKRCAPGSKSGGAGATDDEETAKGIRYNVRTPVNYDPTVAHPLLMVYAPYGKSRTRSEQFHYLTRNGTAAGFIVAYADHRRMAPETILELSEIPRRIEEKWCVDPDRIFLTGHSDGGTIAMGIAFVNGTRDIPAAIVASAVGIRRDDLSDRSCPRPLSVMVMHSVRDTVFPGYGTGTVGWWAECNHCQPQTETLPNGCIAYQGCATGAKTWYCENSHPHSVWPGLNDMIIDFLSTARRGPR